MKIAVDARMIHNSGIGTCISNWMKNGCYDVALGSKEDIKKVDSNIEVIPFTSSIYGIKEQLKFPYKKLKKEKVDILHVPHYNVPIFYHGKMVTTIHDLTHLVLPQFLPNKFAKYYAKIMIKIALVKSVKVFTVSENTKKDILSMFKVNPDKIEVIYNGVGSEFRCKDKKEIEYLYQKYNIDKDKKKLMYVGNLKPHKNLERLLEAFSMLEKKEDYVLLLVGKSFDNQVNLYEKEKELNISDNIIHTGLVEQEELVDFYNLADLFVFPSLYEGFGLPIIEAMACGTNVISANNSSLPEVGGDLIEYFDAYNPIDIKEKIENNINKDLNPKAKEWIKQFNWEDSSNKMKKVMNNVKD